VKRTLSLAVLAGVLVGMLWSAAAASASAPAPSTQASSITWGACSDPNLVAFNAQCGYLSVPLNYNNPNGPKIQLAVSRIQHTSSNYQGVILTNPGGPGGSGLGLDPFLMAQFQADGYGSMVADYDWIGFDPRGVGSSIPSLSCDPNYLGPDRPNYVPYTKQLLDTWLSRSQGYANACASQGAAQTALLQNLTTVDSAKDMDSIRQALGQQQITYYGYSYGTYLGQVYSTLFPSHLRRLVLDSNVDPRGVWYQDNLDQDIAFNRNVNIWFGWLAKYNSTYHLGATEQAVARTFYTTEAQLAQNPAGGVVGPDEWVDTFLLPAYYQEFYVPWAQVFSDWVNNHDAAAANELIGAYDDADGPGNDNELAVYLGVQCTDVQWPTNWHTWSRDNWAIFSFAPFETWGNAWFNAPCIYWPAQASHPVNIDGRGVSNALLIDETLDAATPFPGSVEVRKLFPNSVLLAEPGGTTHAETPDGDLCVDGTIAAYLENGTLPPRNNHAEWDKTCPPPPVPVPPSSNAATAADKGAARLGRLRSRLSTTPGQPTQPLVRLGLPAVEIR
jgi:pimeloyl-ACP methyl ester carboxylesterase